MEFIIVLEHNHKENETYVFYCQWTDNEVELQKLIDVIENTNTEDMNGDYASFDVTRTILPEAAVDAHVKINDFVGYIHMFQKCSGIFTCPEFSEDSHEKAKELDEYFYHGRLREHFSVTKEQLLKQREKYNITFRIR